MFKAYERSIELIRELKPLVQQLGKQDPDLAKQLRKAASSVALNLAEGNRRGGKDKPYHFRVAAGSAAEVGAALDVAQAWGHLQTPDRTLQTLDEVRAMLWRLTHP